MRSTRPAEPIRVLVANSNAIESELLAAAIGRNRRFVAVGAAVNSADIRNLTCDRRPDVLLITASLDDEPNAGLDMLLDFRTSFPSLKIVMLLDSPDPDLVVQAFRLGARGVFSKNSSIRVLGKCINCVQAGQIWATTKEIGFILEALAITRAVRPLRSVNLRKLSARELEVVNSLAEGLTNQEIARRLQLSKHTVRNYMAKIHHKLGTSSRFELLFRALKSPSSGSGWIPDENGLESSNHNRESRGFFSGARPKAA